MEPSSFINETDTQNQGIFCPPFGSSIMKDFQLFRAQRFNARNVKARKKLRLKKPLNLAKEFQKSLVFSFPKQILMNIISRSSTEETPSHILYNLEEENKKSSK